jgi:osmotically-inducible protein OsmY
MRVKIQKAALLVALLASMGAGLSACAPVLIGSAVMGSLMAADRRTTGIQIEDEGIEQRAAQTLRDTLGERAHINVTSYNRQVLLTGEVPTAQDKQLAEHVVSRVENVKSIVNEVSLLGNTTLTQRSSDTLATGRVKAAMVDTQDLFANVFKVVTERGTTYLMGRVTQREATRATEIARSTSGVQKVVRVFEIISEQELQGMSLKPASADVKN